MFNHKSDRSRRAEARAQLRMRDAAANRLSAAMRIEIDRAVNEAADTYPNVDAIIPKHEENVSRILYRAAVNAASVAAARVKSHFKSGMPWVSHKAFDTEDQLSQRVTQWAKKHASEKAKGIAKTTKSRIATAIAEGLVAEEHPYAIARRIRAISDMSVARAKTIARTESLIATNVGQHESMKDMEEATGLTLKKVWIATEDERTRESHQAADGQTVGMDEPFMVGGSPMSFPGDPLGPPEEVINCRCAIVYESARWD